VTFRDRLLGPREGIVDDFVVRRGDGVPAYNLAVVVDDADQGVAEVVRGDDLVDSTPRQLLLSRHLGLSEPAYAHVPLVLGPHRGRLAKRDGAVTLADRAAMGEPPSAVLAVLAGSIGLAQPGEAVTPATLLARFRPEAIPRQPVLFAGGEAASTGSALLRPAHAG
jgi:glutamyl-tRNA synthetase